MQTNTIQVENFEENFDKELTNADFVCSSNPIEGIDLVQKLYDKAKAIQNTFLQAKALATMGFGYYVLKDYAQALEVFNQAISIFDQQDCLSELVNSRNWKGLIYHAVGDTDKALKVHFQSLDLIEKQGTTQNPHIIEARRRTYSNLGLIYGYVDNVKKSTEYYEKSLEGNTHNRDILLSNLSSNYSKLGEHEKALEALLEAYELNKISKRLLYKGFIVCNLIATYADLVRYDEIFDWVNELNSFADELKNTFFDNLYNSCLLNIYIKCAKLPDVDICRSIMTIIDAKKHLYNLNDAIENTDNSKIQIRSAMLLSDYYEVFEDWRQVSIYQKKLIKLNAKKFEKEKMEATERLHIKHEVAQKEQKIKIQELELEKKEIELESKKELEKINLQLEEKVAKRTAKLTYQNQQLREFAFIVSHDLREPLCNIHGISDLLVSAYQEDMGEELGMFVSQIGNSAQYMNLLLKDLLDYTVIEKKIEEMGFQQVDCGAVFYKIRETLKSEITEAKAHIKVHKLPIFYTSMYAIRLLFEQLLSNSLKFRDANRPCKIEVSCMETANEYQFSIVDNGIGMDKVHQKRIFRVFQRLSKYDYEGRGVGLAICKKAVQTLNGTIEVDSKLGIGSTFCFKIPKQI